MNSRIFSIVKSAILMAALTSQIFSQGTEKEAEKKQEEVKTEAVKPAEDKSKKIKGLVYESGDFNLKIGALVQALGQFNIDDKAWDLADNLRTRRVRPSIEGKLGKFIAFKIVPEFGEGKFSILDTFADISPASFFNIRVGKVKTPYSIGFLQSAASTSFFETSTPVNLSPGYDVGAYLWGKVFSDILEYQVGIFNGAPDATNIDTDIDDSKDAVARIFVSPFKTSGVTYLEDLGLGVGTTYGFGRGINLAGTTVNTASVSSFKTTGKATFFSYQAPTTAKPQTGTYLLGNRYRYSPQISYYVGPFGIIGEYLTTVQDLQNTTNLLKATNTAWNVTVSFVLTGQKNSYKGVKVGDDINFSSGNIGAIELAVRYGAINFDKALFTNNLYADSTKSVTSTSSLGVALNWYINSNFRIQTNYELTTFKGGAASTVNDGNRFNEHTILAGVQVNI